MYVYVYIYIYIHMALAKQISVSGEAMILFVKPQYDIGEATIYYVEV